MSTLCCAVVVGGSSDALSPMRIRVPAAGEPGSSGDDEAATTPEASTDSENDSSFESDEDNSSGPGRKSPTRPGHRGWPRCNTRDDKETQHEQQVQNPQPLRKVRFTLHDNDQHNRRVSGVMYRKRWGKGRRAAIRDSALSDVRVMRPVNLVQQQGARPRCNPTSRQIATTDTTSKSTTTGSTDNTRRAWEKRSVAAAVAPFKSTSTNIGTTSTSPSTSASSSAAAASASARPPYYRGTACSTLPPTPASPKKRKVSALSSFSSVSSSSPSSSSLARGGGSSRPSRGAAAMAAAVAAVVQRSAATASALQAAAAKATPAAAAAAAGAQPMDLSCEEVAEEEELDLTCKEELDLSCEGEIRTPICRFLLPCWPVGVEGYEEAGGWRRLGGSHTRENFPRGRRSI